MSAPHLHAPTDSRQLLTAFVLASSPAMLIGIGNLGHQTLVATQNAGMDLPGWRANLLLATGSNVAPDSIVACVVLGASYVLPLLATALLVSYGWDRIFARRSQQPADPAWLMSAWLLVMLVPPSTPAWLIALAMSFAAVIGSHIFGGTGRYLVSPALLGVLFLHFSYPGFTQAALPLPGATLATSWADMAIGEQPIEPLGYLWLGIERGAVGTVSSAACLLGAIYLGVRRAASWRTMLGATAGLLAAASLANQLGEGAASQISWHEHLAVGNFAFAVAFLATDPSTTPLTAGARWAHGLLIGTLTILLRVVDPSHPEGALFAVLLAGLAIPLMDHVGVQAAVRKHSRLAAR